MTPNPTIARIDRSAERLGLDLRKGPGENARSISHGDRLYKITPSGSGVVRIRSYLDEAVTNPRPGYRKGINYVLDAEVVMLPNRLEEILVKIAAES